MESTLNILMLEFQLLDDSKSLEVALLQNLDIPVELVPRCDDGLARPWPSRRGGTLPHPAVPWTLPSFCRPLSGRPLSGATPAEKLGGSPCRHYNRS